MLVVCVYQWVITGSTAGHTLRSDAAELQDCDRLAQSIDAFEASQHTDCIRIAKDLIGHSSDPDVLDQAKLLVILSTRSESGYKAAMQAAEDLKGTEALSDIADRLRSDQAAYEAAVAAQRKIVDKDRGNKTTAEAQLRIAQFTDLYGASRSAIAGYKQVISKYPNEVASVGAMGMLARHYIAVRRYDEGIGLLGNLAKGKQDSRLGAAAGACIGRLWFAKGDMDGAMSAYVESIRRDDDSSSAWAAFRGIATVGIAGKQPERAIGALSGVILSNPPLETAALALYTEGQVYRGTGDAASAEKTFADAGDRYASTLGGSESRFALGQMYAAQGRVDDAEVQWVKLIAEGGRGQKWLVSNTRTDLAHLRYDAALKADSAGDRSRGVTLMGRVISEPGWDGSPEGPLYLYAFWCECAGLYNVNGPAQWLEKSLRAWNQAASVSGDAQNRLEYRYHAATCLAGLGRYSEAMRACEVIVREKTAAPGLVTRCRTLVEDCRRSMAAGGGLNRGGPNSAGGAQDTAAQAYGEGVAK
jgi:tetratricopeptide (TPR) repeat protein